MGSRWDISTVYTKVKMVPTEVKHPWSRVAIDIVDFLRTSSSGHKYILTIIDILTRWLIAVPLRNQNANTIARALIDHLITEHGYSLELLSDQGPNFMSNVKTELTSFLGIKKITSLPYTAC